MNQNTRLPYVTVNKSRGWISLVHRILWTISDIPTIDRNVVFLKDISPGNWASCQWCDFKKKCHSIPRRNCFSFSDVKSFSTNMASKDINDTRCKECGLIRPCPCDAEKSIHDENKEMGLDQPVIIINKRRPSMRRHSYPAPGKM